MVRTSGVLARRGLPAAVYEQWLASRRAAGVPVERVLAWSGSATEAGDPDDAVTGDRSEVGTDDLVLGTRGRLSARNRELAWTHVGWHRIEHGGWNGETRRLTWSCYDGTRGSAGLPVPGRVPELFRERIAASIAVEETVTVGGGRSIVVSGRRDLSEPDPGLEWRRTLSRGLSWNQPGVSELADDVLARLQAEYGR